MKKIITIIAMVFALALPAQAQILVMEGETNELRGGTDQNGDLSNVIFHGSSNDQANYVPLGSGILLLSVLGGAYLLKKRNKE